MQRENIVILRYCFGASSPAHIACEDGSRFRRCRSPSRGGVPCRRGSGTHSDAQVAQIAASIREFGWTNPILVDGDSGIIAGHGRLFGGKKARNGAGAGHRACRPERGAETRLCHRRQQAGSQRWLDAELLGLELGELESLGFDLSLTGFDDLEIAALMSRPIPA